MCGAECQTDHRMVRMKLKMIIQPQRRKVAFKGVRKLNVDRLKNNEIKHDFSVKMETALNQYTLPESTSLWLQSLVFVIATWPLTDVRYTKTRLYSQSDVLSGRVY